MIYIKTSYSMYPKIINIDDLKDIFITRNLNDEYSIYLNRKEESNLNIEIYHNEKAKIVDEVFNELYRQLKSAFAVYSSVAKINNSTIISVDKMAKNIETKWSEKQ